MLLCFFKVAYLQGSRSTSSFFILSNSALVSMAGVLLCWLRSTVALSASLFLWSRLEWDVLTVVHSPLALVAVLLRLLDSAQNMIATARLLPYEHMSCIAHSLQRLITTSIRDSGFENVLSKCRKLVGHFKHSPCQLLSAFLQHPIALQLRRNAVHRFLRSAVLRYVELLKKTSAMSTQCLYGMQLLQDNFDYWPTSSDLRLMWQPLHFSGVPVEFI